MNKNVIKVKAQSRAKRKLKIRSKISGTAALPRVTIFRSNRYLTVQAIDDVAAVTLTALHSKSLSVNANKEGAKTLGTKFAEQLKSTGIETIVFDRNGLRFHGVVESFASALRENGIAF